MLNHLRQRTGSIVRSYLTSPVCIQVQHGSTSKRHKKNVRLCHAVHLFVEAKFNFEDAFDLESQLTDDERMTRDQFRSYCQDKLMPRIIEANRKESQSTFAARAKALPLF